MRLPESMQMFVTWEARARTEHQHSAGGRAWHCTLLEVKGKKIMGLGISYLGIHSRNNVVIELLRGAQPI